MLENGASLSPRPKVSIFLVNFGKHTQKAILQKSFFSPQHGFNSY